MARTVAATSARYLLVVGLYALGMAASARAQATDSTTETDTTEVRFGALAGAAAHFSGRRSEYAFELGGRVEAEHDEWLWYGAEATALVTRGPAPCVALLSADCGTVTRITPIVSGQLRVEAGGRRARPYGMGLLGWGIVFDVPFPTVLGIGAGVRLPNFVVGSDAGLELRYRVIGPLDEFDGHWELLLAWHP